VRSASMRDRRGRSRRACQPLQLAQHLVCQDRRNHGA
jgi:hypothetical protein